MFCNEMIKEEVAEKMVLSLEERAYQAEVSLEGINKDNWQNFIDDNLDPTGEIRCQDFTDISWEYAKRFGNIGDESFEEAKDECVDLALSILEERH